MLNLFQHPTCKAACIAAQRVGSRNKFGMTGSVNVISPSEASGFYLFAMTFSIFFLILLLSF